MSHIWELAGNEVYINQSRGVAKVRLCLSRLKSWDPG